MNSSNHSSDGSRRFRVKGLRLRLLARSRSAIFGNSVESTISAVHEPSLFSSNGAGESDIGGELVRQGALVRLRRHVPDNRLSFQRWYCDPEIAYLLRHDLKPLSERQSRGYFDTIILPLSAEGHSFAIHETANDRLIGTAALTDAGPAGAHAALFRIVIGEKEFWEHGYGTEATRLVVEEAFETFGLEEVRLEVFAHNPRAIGAYEKVGFIKRGEHVELVPPDRTPLHVEEMALLKSEYYDYQLDRDEPSIFASEV